MKNKTFIISIIVVVIIFGVIFAAVNLSSPRKKVSEQQAQKQAASILKQPFDAKATIKMQDLVLVADVNKTTQGTATIKIKEPKTLADMQFEYDGQDIKIGYKGIFVKLNQDSKIVSTLAAVIVNSIDKAASGSGIDVNIEGDALIVSGESESGKFLINIDKKKGAIASINLPELDFECSFDI